MTTTLLDRQANHRDILETSNESYRLKHSAGNMKETIAKKEQKTGVLIGSSEWFNFQRKSRVSIPCKSKRFGFNFGRLKGVLAAGRKNEKIFL
jgi:hypothetical protein